MFGNKFESKASRLAVLVAVVAMALPCVGAPIPADLRCEWRMNNEAVGDICPELYWEADGQRACQVLVASSADKLAPGQADAWDSGKVESRLPIVEYAGEKLANQTTYYWKVRLWGEEDEPGLWSQVQRFTTKFDPLPSLRPHMRYFINGGGKDMETLARLYDLSFRAGANEIRPEYLSVGSCLMATMVIPSDKHDDLAAWCVAQGLSDEGVPEEMFCHFCNDYDVTLHVGAQRPHDDYVMNIGHPNYQRYLAEKYMPDRLAGGQDGWWVDTTPTDVAGIGRHADVLEYPRGPGETDAWMRDMQMALARVKINLPDGVLTANGWLASPFVLDGMERETWWLRVNTPSTALEASMRSVVELDRRGKIQLLQYNPVFDPQHAQFGPKVPVSRDRDAIFGLAGYYLCAGDYTTYGTGGMPWEEPLTWYTPAVEFDIGTPQGDYQRLVITESDVSERPNLLANGDFELDDDGDGLPDRWQVTPPLEFDETVVKSGKRSVRIDSDSLQTNNMCRYYLELGPNTTYTLSAWMKTDNISGGQGAQIYVYDFEGAETGGIGMQMGGTNDWTRVHQCFTTAEDAWGRVTFRISLSTGTAWLPGRGGHPHTRKVRTPTQSLQGNWGTPPSGCGGEPMRRVA